MDTFVTGVTGFVGRYTAARMLQRREGNLHCLVRADDAEHGRQRLRKSLARAWHGDGLHDAMERVVPVVGDLTAPGLGLTEAVADGIAERCGAYLHAAADVRFDQALDDARRRNVEGTSKVVALARKAAARGALRRLDWVGTAFVAGLRTDRVLETELEHDAGWKNAYEQSKYEAERWLVAEASDLPLTVLRPSIVVGESTTGATTNFGMLYWPVQLYARGWWRTVVGREATTVDIVPVDYVADGIERLTRGDAAVGGAYHLCSGPDGQRTIGQLAAQAQAIFDAPPARYADPDFFLTWVRPVLDLFLWGKRGRVLKSGGRFFIPYFSGNPTFDISRAQTALAPEGITPPTVEDYLGTLFDYALKTDFGRKPAG